MSKAVPSAIIYLVVRLFFLGLFNLKNGQILDKNQGIT